MGWVLLPLLCVVTGLTLGLLLQGKPLGALGLLPLLLIALIIAENVRSERRSGA